MHFEDQLAAEKKCGHMGGKVLVPTASFVRTLNAARLATDVLDVPTVIIARTDALAATLITSDIDEADRAFTTGERTTEGYFHIRNGMRRRRRARAGVCAVRGSALVRDVTPDLAEAKQFAESVHAQFPGKMLAYNCSPSFNWSRNLDATTIAKFQRELARDGLQVPVHHARRLAHDQLRVVRSCTPLQH